MLLEECDSTNAEVRRRLDSGQISRANAHGAWISAKRQTDGRGRQGRQWISNEGGLYISIVVQSSSLENVTWIPLTVAVSVSKLLNDMHPSSKVEIKWPNDIFIEGVKAGGILVEGLGGLEKHFLFIIGIGLNVLDSPHAIDQPTTHLKKYFSHFDLDTFRSNLVSQVLKDFDHLQKSGPAEIRDQFLENSVFKKNTPISWSLNSEQSETGVVLGLGSNGQLLVRNDSDEEKSLYASDVKVRKF